MISHENICHAAMKIGFSQNLFRCCVFTGSYLHEPGEKEREREGVIIILTKWFTAEGYKLELGQVNICLSKTKSQQIHKLHFK